MYLSSLMRAEDSSRQFDYSFSEINLLTGSSDDNKMINSLEGKEAEGNNKSELKTVIESANQGVQVFNKSIEFSIHEATNKIMIKIIDNETAEVIKEIPAEKILDMLAKFCEMAGILLDEKI
ncbi:MAG: flagellar protein FlaG [Firmicutes bacterium]|nr:flagellar protein FlaG [Bacillota bacterium]